MTAKIIQFRPRANPNRDRQLELKHMAAELLIAAGIVQIRDTAPSEMNMDEPA